MSNKIKQKWLFTPGPLSTSKKTKEAMMVDLGSREEDFIKLNQLVCKNLIKIASAKNYICVPIQGSGTFGIEAALLSVLKKNSKILIISVTFFSSQLVSKFSLIALLIIFFANTFAFFIFSK